jgi:DNA-binding Lrp family transcriptional regulator
MLAALQKGIPFARRPFEEISREIGCSESDLMGFVKDSIANGTARRFGAVFDVRRLGYSSALCCAQVSDPDDVASRLVGFQEVTHCYLREANGCPNLWWTWSAPNGLFESSLAKVDVPFFALPASVRYKIDVMFDVAARVREESTIDSLPPPDETEKRIIRALQGNTEIRPDYYSAIAEKVGMKEWDLLATLEMWRRQGRLKRIALLLNHRRIGYSANGMCCFRIEGDTAEAGRALAELDAVTHCYERPACKAFPYNLYAMIHCTSVEEANAGFEALKERLSALEPSPSGSVMLVSTKEYKKTSMSFYQ